MAVKTITIDMAAYEALKRHKRRGQSFSDVIKEHFTGGTTGAALREVIGRVDLEEATLDAVDEIVASRSRDRAEAPEL